MSEKFEEMTVIELRRAAKQMGVKLGAGISKQGIVDKLTEAVANQPVLAERLAPADDAPAPAPTAPVRRASIIADDEPEDDEDDVPVLTPNPDLQMPRRTPAPGYTPPAAQSGASSLSAISSKAPAFTMEGSRAWHNPRAYAPQNYPRTTANTWNPRPGQPGAPGDPRGYNRPMPGTRAPQRPAGHAQHFGPESGEQDGRAEYRPGYNPGGDYAQQPAPRNEYQSGWRGDYAPQQATASGYYHKDPPGPTGPNMADMLMAGDCVDGAGVLDVHPEGYAFLRTDGYLPGRSDVYVSNAQVRRFNLRSGDYVEGKVRPQRENDRSAAMLYITDVNSRGAEENANRVSFENLTPLYPKKKLEFSQKDGDPTLRVLDLLCPMGFGQRALIRTQPGSGKTTLIQKMAAALARNSGRTQVMVLLLDERPEEIPLMNEAVKAEVIAAPFDMSLENQMKLSEMALERAMRLVEMKKDVVFFVDSLSKLAKAYAASAPQAARTLPNGIVAGSLTKPRRLFAAARNTKEAGTLTVIAAVDADDPVAEEMRGACNMEIVCSKALCDRGVFPAIDLNKCQARRSDLLLTEAELAALEKMKNALRNKNPLEGMQFILSLVEKTESNQALLENLDTLLAGENA